MGRPLRVSIASLSSKGHQICMYFTPKCNTCLCWHASHMPIMVPMQMSLLMLQLNIQFAPTSPSNASVCTHMRSCFVCCMQGVFATTNKFLRRWFKIHHKSPHVKSLSPLKLMELLLGSPIVAIIEKSQL